MISFPGVVTILVSQDTPDLALKPNSSLKVGCTIAEVSNPDLYWYRWTASGGMEVKFVSRGVNMMDPTEVDGFTARRTVELQMSLESVSVQPSEPAVWYCAASRHSDTDLSRSCTKTIHHCFFLFFFCLSSKLQ